MVKKFNLLLLSILLSIFYWIFLEFHKIVEESVTSDKIDEIMITNKGTLIEKPFTKIKKSPPLIDHHVVRTWWWYIIQWEIGKTTFTTKYVCSS